MAFTASAPADQSISHRLADTVKGGELSYMALAMEREQIVYRSLLMQPGAVPTDPTPIPARLVRGCIAMAFTASVPADQSSHRLAHTFPITVKGGELICSPAGRGCRGFDRAHHIMHAQPL